MPPLLSQQPSTDSSSDLSSVSMSSTTAAVPEPSADGADKSKKHSVHFCERVLAYEYVALADLSDEEISATWYNRRELREIHKRNDKLVKQMVCGEEIGPEDCPRGLECRTPVGHRLRHKHRRQASKAVIEYQELQVESGVTSNAESLARVYIDHTSASLSMARLMATIDAQFVESEYGVVLDADDCSSNAASDSTPSETTPCKVSPRSRCMESSPSCAHQSSNSPSTIVAVRAA